MNLEIRELTPELWPELERLFGPNGACGGCWCMWWRLRGREEWNRARGEPNRRRFRALIKAGKVHGLLAFADGEPVGWCNFEIKSELDRLARSPSLKTDDDGEVWSIPCFFVKAGWRQKGIAERLLKEAVKAIRRRGGKIAEGYPTAPKTAKGGPISSVNFAWTGFPGMFDRSGFKAAAAKPVGKQRVRRKI